MSVESVALPVPRRRTGIRARLKKIKPPSGWVLYYAILMPSNLGYAAYGLMKSMRGHVAYGPVSCIFVLAFVVAKNRFHYFRRLESQDDAAMIPPVPVLFWIFLGYHLVNLAIFWVLATP